MFLHAGLTEALPTPGPPLLISGTLIGFLQVALRLVDRTLGVVAGLHRQLVLVHGTAALAGEVEDFA